MQILTTAAELRATPHIAGQSIFWRCGDCQTVAEVGANPGCGTGYGYASDAPDAAPICYACCGKRETARMIKTGRATLYLVGDAARGYRVTDWPSVMSFPATVRRGRHNMARWRYDAWFTGPDGKPWHGVTYGDNTQICHCRRVKAA